MKTNLLTQGCNSYATRPNGRTLNRIAVAGLTRS
jgi:hypothetical protein